MSQARVLVPATAGDYRALAERRLPRFLFDYIDGGAGCAGCRLQHIGVKVDLPTPGMRHRDTRNGMLAGSVGARWGKAQQLLARPGWINDVALRGKPHSFGSLDGLVPNATDLNSFKAWIDAQFDPSVTWSDIAWLRSIWPGKRQLDSVASTISKLPAIADAVGERVEVLVDGGVRNGVDVFKAVALGAQGLAQLLATFQREFEVAMALTGVTQVNQINRGLLDPVLDGASQPPR